MPPKLRIAHAKEGHFTFNQVSKLSYLKGPTVWKPRTGPVWECNEVTPPNGSSLESCLIKSNDSLVSMNCFWIVISAYGNNYKSITLFEKEGKWVIIPILYVARESKRLAQGYTIYYLWLQTFGPGLLSFLFFTVWSIIGKQCQHIMSGNL